MPMGGLPAMPVLARRMRFAAAGRERMAVSMCSTLSGVAVLYGRPHNALGCVTFAALRALWRGSVAIHLTAGAVW